MTGVSAEWVDSSSFTTLSVSVPDEGTYRISYWVVNMDNSNTSGPAELTVPANSRSPIIIDELSSDNCYTVLIEAVLPESKTSVNTSVGIGEHIHYIHLFIYYSILPFYIEAWHIDSILHVPLFIMCAVCISIVPFFQFVHRGRHCHCSCCHCHSPFPFGSEWLFCQASSFANWHTFR